MLSLNLFTYKKKDPNNPPHTNLLQMLAIILWWNIYIYIYRDITFYTIDLDFKLLMEYIFYIVEIMNVHPYNCEEGFWVGYILSLLIPTK